MHKDEYARALVEALEGTEGKEAGARAERFVALIRRAGHIRLLPKILAAYERMTKAEKERVGAVVSVAKESDAHEYERAIREDALTLGARESAIAIRTDETLIGGYRIATHDKMIDRSFKRSLATMYHQAINN